MLVIDHANPVHEQAAGQAHTQKSEDGAGPTTQAVTDENGHVGGVQAREGLADGEQFNEGAVVEPSALGNEAVAEIGDDTAAETGGADDEEFRENLEQGRRCGRVGGRSGWGRRGGDGFTHGFAAHFP
jgi:hypothetical protein